MDLLSATASVIACYQLASKVACQCLRYVRGVRQADKDCDLVVAQIQMFQLSLHHLQGMLANEAVNPSGGNRLKFLSEIMNGNSASILLCSRELEEIQAKLAKAQSGGNLRQAFHRLSWPLKQEEVDRAVSTLKNFAAAVNTGLAIDSNEVLRGIDSTTRDISSTTRQMLNFMESAEAQQKQLEKLRKDEEERQKREKIREQVLGWLAHPDPSEIQNVASRARKSPKTGRWFLNGAAFQAFRKTPRSVLWLHGDSGCGKSILCSAVIDELRANRSEQPPSVRLAYWYFSVNDANRRSVQNLVRALFTQLCPASEVPPALFKLWDANRKGREAPQVSDSIQALVQMLGEISVDGARPPIFIVIDALDESNESERAEIINMLRHIMLLKIDIQLLVTSRSTTLEIERRLQDVVRLLNVIIERQYADEDILTHISEQLQDDEDLNKWPSHLQDDIKEALIAGAAGMFRWVDCQLQAICRCRKPKELRSALTSLPKDLRELYARELANVEDLAVEDVRKLLGWLTYPQRPLRIEEAAEMLAVDLDSDPPCFDEGNRMPRPEDILKICGSLVRVDQNPEGRNYLGERAEVQTLTAAHASVIDFIKEERVCIGRELEVFYTRAAMNLEMAETCLAYLLNVVEGDSVLHDEIITNYPFARFSAEFWDDFYREVVASSRESEVDMTRVNALVMRLFASRETMLKWIQLCDPDDDTYKVDFDTPLSYVKPVMYYAALLGLPDIVSRLVEDGHSVDEMADEGLVGWPGWGMPLVAACEYGRENTASILLDKGADPDLPGTGNVRPLRAAIGRNHIGIVKLLLKTKRVNVNARVHLNRKKSKSPLYLAAESGSLETVIALLEAGADPNIQAGPEHSALQAACYGGSADIVEVLLEYGANAEMYGGRSGSPLQAACACPSLRIVKILVGVPVDVNYVGNGNASALYLASAVRDPEMLSVLLEHGAKTDIYGETFDNPLRVASKYGDLAIVQILLNAGIDVNRKGGGHGTALVAACRCGSTSVVKSLLESDADPNIQECGPFDNALQTACEADKADIALLLLEHKADPNLHGGKHGSALHAAFARGNELIINALLTRGADIKYRGGNYCTVLQAAVASENEAAVRFALESGLSANEKGGRFTYPLLRATAIDTCPDSIVQLLLEKGADPNLEREGDDCADQAFRTALQHTTSVSKASLLLDAGAKLDTFSGLLGTALHGVIAHGGNQRTSIIKFLIDRGADVNRKADIIGPPLCYASADAGLDIVRLLIEAGADLHSVDMVGHSALHMAISQSQAGIELFDYYIELGLDPLLLDRRGCNGLHYAARANNLLVLRKILERKPDINVIDDYGWTPLHWAAASTRISTHIIKVLLDEGCNKAVKDKAGMTALDLAKKLDNDKLVAILTTGSAPIGLLENDVFSAYEEPSFYNCDGCMITPSVCGYEDWYTCTDCYSEYDFCFRCIVDKDIIHVSDHSWSSKPSTEFRAYM